MLEKAVKKPPFFVCILLYLYNKGRFLMIAVRLPEEIEKRLEKLARITGRTKSYYVRQAILEKLEELEDLYIAEKRLEDIKLGKAETVPLEKVLKRHGLED